MKKLMIAAVTVCVAALAQAATISWGSGYLKGPTSATSGDVGNTLISKTIGTWTATLLIFSDAAGANLLASDQMTMTVTATSGSGAFSVAASVYDDDTKPNTAGTVGATSFSSPVGMKKTSAQWSGLGNGQDYYYQIIVKGETAAYKAEKSTDIMAFTTESSPTTQKKLNFDNTTTLGTGWTNAAWTVTAAPEPTSGLLLVLGMGVLALRRRRA